MHLQSSAPGPVNVFNTFPFLLLRSPFIHMPLSDSHLLPWLQLLLWMCTTQGERQRSPSSSKISQRNILNKYVSMAWVNWTLYLYVCNDVDITLCTQYFDRCAIEVLCVHLCVCLCVREFSRILLRLNGGNSITFTKDGTCICYTIQYIYSVYRCVLLKCIQSKEKFRMWITDRAKYQKSIESNWHRKNYHGFRSFFNSLSLRIFLSNL